MARIVPIFNPLCQQPVGRAALKWRTKGMSAWSGPDINLCGKPAAFHVDDVPTCNQHVRKFTVVEKGQVQS